MALLLGASVIAVSAQAGEAAPGASRSVTTYRVVGAVHTSSASKDDRPFYTGSSSSAWSLAPPTRKASNLVTVMLSPLVNGGGTVNVRGVFKASAKTPGHPACSLAAATGSTKYPAAAPGPFEFTISPDPSSPSRVLVSFGVFVNLFATLSNGYFGTECSTSVTGEPSGDLLTVKSVPKSLFGRKRIVIRYAGATNENKIAYRWSTTFTLVRVETH